jgi:prolyl oligopeptidase
MRRFPLACSAALCLIGTAVFCASTVKPPLAPVKPVIETLWGHKVIDDYRYMEALGPETLAWMKAEGAYTRAVLDGIGPLAKLKTDVAAFTGSFGLVQGFVRYGSRMFYEERAPGSDNFDLIVADAQGKRKLIDVAALRAANGGKPFAINYFLASPDGTKVAAGVSEGGSEDASLSVYDAASGAKIAGPIDRARFGATAWSDDSRQLYFIRLAKLESNAPATDTYKNATADVWDLKSEPVAILGAGLGHGPRIEPQEFPAVQITPGSTVAAAISINGVQNEIAMWLGSAATASDPLAKWTPFVTRDDGITSGDIRGSDIFLLSHKDAPTFKVLAVKAGQPLRAAVTLVPAQADRVIEAIHAAADGLYVLARHGAYSQLLRVPVGSRAIEEIALPFSGHIAAAFTDPRSPGIVLTLSSWVVPESVYAYTPASRSPMAILTPRPMWSATCPPRRGMA